MKSWTIVAAAAIVLAAVSPAAAQPASTYVRVVKLFSTMDGIDQAIELEVVRVGNTPLALAGKNVAVRDVRGHTRSFALSGVADGPDPPGTLVIISNAWLDGLVSWWDWGAYGDFDAPDYFLPIDGGTIVIDGMDELAYGPLPLDGRTARRRDGSDTPAVFARFNSYDRSAVVLREYYNAELDSYFMTARLDEMLSLARGDVAGWLPTGLALFVQVVLEHELAAPVCRFLLLDPQRYSHFFSAFAAECNAVAASSTAVLESPAAFRVSLPKDGTCPEFAVYRLPSGAYTLFDVGEPVYRLWNGKVPANHRYVSDLAEREAMIARGWRPEGAGKDGIAWCGDAATPPPPPQ